MGDAGRSDVLSTFFTVLIDFIVNELKGNAFAAALEIGAEFGSFIGLSEGRGRKVDKIGFVEETSRGFVMTILGGGPCRKCPLHAGLKLSKLRTGFN